MSPKWEIATRDLDQELEHAACVREFARSITEGKHQGHFERKDYIGLGLFNRCLQTHEAIEILIRRSLVDDAWSLVRSLVEHAVNSAYMLYVADAQTADNYADLMHYQRYMDLQALKSTDPAVLRRIVSPEEEEEIRQRFIAVRSKFDSAPGDKWCADDRLYKRAARVDRERGTEFLWLVHSLWRYGSAYVHGTATALSAQMTETAEGVTFQRKYTREEAANTLRNANFAFYLILLPLDVHLGGKNTSEINRRFEAWASGA